MRQRRTIAYVFVVFCVCIGLIMIAFGGCGHDKSNNTLTSPNTDSTESFSHDGVTLTATTKVSEESKTTVVVDQSGKTILTLIGTMNEINVIFPEHGTKTFQFPSLMSILPSNFSMNRLAVYIAGHILTENIAKLQRPYYRNYPGCDWWPDDDWVMS